MNIEIGKKYKTRGGWMAEVVGNKGDFEVNHGIEKQGIWYHNKDGSYGGGRPDYDLIAPWEDSLDTPVLDSIITDTAAIRRQYACAALTGLLSRQPNFAKDNEIAESYATASFIFADAMMKAEGE